MGVGDPEKEQHEQARVKATANLRRLNRPRDDSDSDDESTSGGNGKERPRKENLELDQYESQIALEVVAPEDIPVGFDVFIDEIDAVLGQRRSGEHEASGMVKAEFMTLWDGLTSANTENFDMDYVTRVMAGMSGSDIKESCRDAAMAPVREYIREQRQKGVAMAGVRADSVRGIRTSDFFGTKGGQIINNNHAKVIKESSKHTRGKQEGSSDEYEDVDETLAESMD
ncbi:putative protein MSP1 [Glarea lozoyensis 74030]|uniref:AAA ATPase AAA+ lid domain-containing protein n=1 Tax=Glarea lozoyensis (strain ATCC 74030 / MF5533) TaxID=1104152 RepID=H0EW12_GLAL7|nr:putative protein MSP1 [Glarea lozoyensis 74030]